MKYNKLNQLLLKYWNNIDIIKIKTQRLYLESQVFVLIMSLYYNDYTPQTGKCVIKEDITFILNGDKFTNPYPTSSIYTILKSEKGRKGITNWDCWYKEP